MRRTGICLALVLGLAFITMPASGCGGGGGGGGGAAIPGSPVFRDLPVKWLDNDNSGGLNVGDSLILCFDRSVTSGANLPTGDITLAGAGGSLVGATYTDGPGAGKMTINLLGAATVTLGKTAGTTMQVSGANTLTNPVAPATVGATPAATPNTIMGNISDSGQFIGGASLSIAMFDVDNDTDMDIIAGRAGLNLVFINTGLNTGVFVAGMAITNDVLAASTNNLCWGTIDNDALPDLVACNGPGVQSIKYLNTLATPGLFFTDVAGLPPANRSVMSNVTANAPLLNATGCVISGQPAGANWDGLLGGDIFLAHAGAQNRVFFCNLAGQVNNDNTLAGVTPIANVGGPATDTRAVAGGTIDAGNITVDVVTADDMGAAPGVVTRYLVTVGVPPTFTPAVLAGTLANPRALRLCDLDGDGDLDLVVGYTSGNGMQIYRNDGAGTGVYSLQTTLPGGNVFSLACTDVDGDGLRDIIQGRGNNGGIAVFLNCGAFAFADSGVSIPGNFLGLQATQMPATGLDGKGLGDIAGADSASVNKLVISGK